MSFSPGGRFDCESICSDNRSGPAGVAGLQFNAAGNETRYDFPKCIAVAKSVGYKGVYSVEYEGRGDPYDGVQKVVNELDKYL